MTYYLYMIELSGCYLDKMLKKEDNGYYFFKVMLKKNIKISKLYDQKRRAL